MRNTFKLVVIGACLSVIAFNTLAKNVDANAFDIIAHRGASGYLPEHTLAAAVLAHAQGTDYIEQDVVLSKDNIPMVLHDIHLETVTDVEQRFPARRRNDGRWYVIDFTLEELKTLHIHEREDKQGKKVFPQRYKGKGTFTIASLQEHISTILSLNRTTGQNTGLYLEIKAPRFHRQAGYDISKRVLDELNVFDLNTKDARLYLQCFDFNEIKRLRTEFKTPVKLVQLIGENSWRYSPTDYDFLKTPAGLSEVALYANGIGPWIGQVLPLDEAAKASHPEFLSLAKQLGLNIHAYTLRQETLPANTNANRILDALQARGVNGVFSDQVPLVRHWRESRAIE